MNQKIQLYIENEQVDVFQDGSINIVSSIKDFRSPDKLFTDLVETFHYLLLQETIKYLNITTIMIYLKQVLMQEKQSQLE